MVGGRVGDWGRMKETGVIAIRVDASIVMGTGHVMRCLTLADSLRIRGIRCHFICCAHPGNMIAAIRQKGFEVTELPLDFVRFQPSPKLFTSLLAYADWLGSDWRSDAERTLSVVRAIKPDMLVVDHYAIDIKWEEVLRPYVRRIMVIDDLADRKHECDVLLDQNLGRSVGDYASKVPSYCTVLAGPSYALLRPEFAELRDYSLTRRQHPLVKKLLITMGGVDGFNATSLVLKALKHSSLSEDCCITVVIGPRAPWQQQVRELAASMQWSTEVRVGVGNMAQLMAESDLAIGAAGSTSWERCCLGLPALLVVLAENQWFGAEALNRHEAVFLIGETDDIERQLPRAIEIVAQSEILARMSGAASKITDGRGVEKLSELLDVQNG